MSMLILKDATLVEDSWVTIADDQPVPADGDVLVSLARWQSERTALAARGGRTGVVMEAAHDAAEIANDLDRLPLIALTFDIYRDGRSYSTARRLRQHYGYTGEIRAVGDVLHDQLNFMRRCGFDSFVLAEGKSAEDALRAFDEITVAYQGAADDPRPLFRREVRG